MCFNQIYNQCITINLIKKKESSMKNTAIQQNASSNQIRENRLKMRNKIKLNTDFTDKKHKSDEINTTDTLHLKKPNNTIKIDAFNILNSKQFILGNFEDSYELKEKIGQGAHATVYRCIQRATRTEYAVKITKQNDQELLYSSKQQFKILKNLSYPNIMKAQVFYIDKVKMTTYLICELCEYPQLAMFLQHNVKPLSICQATLIMTQIMQTLQYLHKNGVCHRDIKPQNILYNPLTKKIKLIDFDCSKIKREFQQKFQMWTKMGSLHYQAPQYFQLGTYDQKVDIWAAGVIGFRMITGQLPFKSNYHQRMVQMITTGEINFQQYQIPYQFKEMLRKMLQKDAKKRISARDCCRLPIMLKTITVKNTNIIDDFEVESNFQLKASKTCQQFHFNRQRVMSQQKINNSKQLLKYFCFVAEA